MQELVTRHNVNQHKVNEVCTVSCGHLNLLWSYNIKLYGITCGSVYILSSCEIVLSMHSLVRCSTLH